MRAREVAARAVQVAEHQEGGADVAVDGGQAGGIGDRTGVQAAPLPERQGGGRAGAGKGGDAVAAQAVGEDLDGTLARRPAREAVDVPNQK